MAAEDLVPCPAPAREAADEWLQRIGFSLCVASIVFLILALLQGAWLLAPDGTAAPADFVNVWAAGRLVVAGKAAAAYDWTIHKQAEEAALGTAFPAYYPWPYPPPFLLAAAPLALLPYSVALLVWSAGTMLVFALTIRRIVGHLAGLMLAIGFPASLFNFEVGQNGFVTAALLGAALLVLPRRPGLAGGLVGLLTFKPHLGLVLPVALVAGREWRACAAAAAVGLALAALSVAAFGAAPWLHFLHALSLISDHVLARGEGDFAKLQSMFGLARVLGAGAGAAWSLQIALALATAVAVGMLWRSEAAYELKAAAVAVAVLLATPYVYIYDLVLLAPALAFLLRLARRQGFEGGESAGMAAAAGLILSFPFVPLGLPTGFLATVLIAVLIGRRVLAWHSGKLWPARTGMIPQPEKS